MVGRPDHKDADKEDEKAALWIEQQSDEPQQQTAPNETNLRLSMKNNKAAPSHRRVVSAADGIPILNHKEEAQIVIQHILENKEQKTVLEANSNKPTLSEVRQSLITGRPTNPVPEPTLMETTEYLKALHQEHDGDAIVPSTTTTTTAEDQADPAFLLFDKDNGTDLADVNAVDRVVLVTQVLKTAVNANNNATEPSDSGASSSGDEKNNNQHDENLIHEVDEESPDDVVVQTPSTTASIPTTTHGSDKTTTTTKPNNKQRQGLFAVPGTTTRAMKHAYKAGAQEWSILHDFFQPQRKHFVRVVVLFVAMCVIPLTGTAALLFYAGENPPTGRCRNDQEPESDACTNATASASWWILFLGVRQVVTWLLARGTDLFVIDFLILQHSFVVRVLGPQLSLIVVQSKGWPSILFWWAMWDFLLLYGEDDFSDHWLHWQDYVTLFTDENPSGNITTTSAYRRVLISAVIVAIATCIKRHLTGLHLGGRLCARYSDKLKELTKDVLLISELALWARLKHQRKKEKASKEAQRYLSEGTSSEARVPDSNANISKKNSDSVSVSLNDLATSGASAKESRSERPEFTDFTGILVPWEDPNDGPAGKAVSGNEIIEFRQAFSVITRPFFFSSAFGAVGTRDECLKSAELLYRRLLKLMESEDELLDLGTMTKWMYKGCHKPEEKENAAALVELLLPDLDDKISLVGFVTAIDLVYRNLRVFESSVKNHSHVDKSYEKVINIIFAFFMGCVVLAIMGTNPIIFIGSVSALVVSFAFMIGPGVSQQFEGVLMVLVRQPYDIGDRIAIATVDNAPSVDGSLHWMVEKIDLVTTTARLTATGEVATFSNGTLSRTRLINMNRSPDAVVYVPVRFATSVPYSTVLVFREAIEKFVTDRPQEWAALSGFRATRVESQLNFIEYTIVLTHRNKWQDVLPILVSKAAVASFAVEVQEQLGCHYQAPSMGVEISMAENRQGKLPQPSLSAESLLDVAKQFPAKKDD